MVTYLDAERSATLLSRPAPQIAARLLGALFTNQTADGAVTVRLTEVEAYAGGRDPGSHAYRGRTPRTAVMFGRAGHLYVYFSYGMHWCANVVTGEDGTASAVLLRAGEVIEGRDLAYTRRPACRADRDLARGPARLASALGLDGAANGTRVSFSTVGPPATAGPGATLRIRSRRPRSDQIASGPRVGVSGPGGDGERFGWRFWLSGDRTVSGYRPGERRS